MKDIRPDDPISELTPDGMAKSWFGAAIGLVCGFILLIELVRFAFH